MLSEPNDHEYVLEKLHVSERIHNAILESVVTGDSILQQELTIQSQVRMLVDILSTLQENNIPIESYIQGDF